MQDKEFDQLWRDKLGGAEIEPSANLWGKIETELKPKKKGSFPVFWVAAATALVLMAAGLLFTKTEKLRLQGVAPLVQNAPLPGQASLRPKVANEAPAAPQPYIGTPLIIAPSIDINYTSSGNTPAKRANKKNSTALQPVDENDRLNTALAITEPLRVKDGRNEIHTVVSTNSENIVADEVVNENDQAEKRGIRNVGDLVNFIVEKVDKREQKLLKFSTDDDNSSLIGINIGVLKINRNK